MNTKKRDEYKPFTHIPGVVRAMKKTPKSLHEWLNYSHNHNGISPTGYVLVVLPENHGNRRPQAVNKALRKFVRECFADTEYVKARVPHPFPDEEAVYQSEKFPEEGLRVDVRQGDFGECVAHFLLSEAPPFGYTLPIYRIRYKSSKNSPLFGIDITGYAFVKDEKPILCHAEVRTKRTRDDRMLRKGNNCLKRIDRKKELESLGFIATRLHEQKRIAEMNRISVFSETWIDKQPFDRKHVFFGIVDGSLPIEPALVKFNDASNKVDGLTVCLVSIRDLRNLVSQVFAP